ncbi:MAG: hypothetical protein ACI9IO_001952 [Cyanobium sp.]|jgi:hypothetical protein
MQVGLQELDSPNATVRILYSPCRTQGSATPLPWALAPPVQAVLIFNFYESGGNLVVEGTGSLNLPSSHLYASSCTGVSALDNVFCTGLSSNVMLMGSLGGSPLARA